MHRRDMLGPGAAAAGRPARVAVARGLRARLPMARQASTARPGAIRSSAVRRGATSLPKAMPQVLDRRHG